MRGGRYQALIVVILLLTALPYTPLMNIQSAQHIAPGVQQRDDSFPEMDSDGDGLNDSYELELGFDPFEFDSDGDGQGEIWIGASGWASTNVEKIRAKSYGYDETMKLKEKRLSTIGITEKS